MVIIMFTFKFPGAEALALSCFLKSRIFHFLVQHLVLVLLQKFMTCPPGDMGL